MRPEERASTSRPVIFGRIAEPKSIPSRRGGGGRAEFADPAARKLRIEARFVEASSALGNEVQLAESIQAADPQLVLVFEALDEQIDLERVAEKIGVEILVQAEGSAVPDSEVSLKSENPRNPFITSCLHAVCANQRAFDNLLRLWRAWKADETLPYGYSKIRELFEHLKDVRPWGPQDRLGAVDWTEYLSGRVDDKPHSIEVELWYRGSAAKRAESARQVTELIELSGGAVTNSALIDQIGYHALRCSVPTQVLVDLASGNHDAVQVVKSANVMYLRVSGQSLPIVGPLADEASPANGPMPVGEPVLCLLDGAPVANHPLLRGRVEVHDPDDLLSDSTVEERRHGTWMSSVAVWGDRGADAPSASRPVLVRPILTPAIDSVDRVEELPSEALVPDLMWRVFRELFEGSDSEPAVAESIAIVNLSVGDPSARFDTIMSSWARMIDWLSYEYGVLVVVSAGNHPKLDLSPDSSATILGATGDDRRRAVLEALARRRNDRRLLAPAEAVNALTVGAIHRDHSSAVPLGYVADPTDGRDSISPISASGGGYRRSVKPELADSGGRAFFRQPHAASESIVFTGISSVGPGVKVAAPTVPSETHIVGTSPAAALVSRRAAGLYDVVRDISAGSPTTRRQRASAIKALLVHGTAMPSADEYEPLLPEDSFGNGAIVRDLSGGCAQNEAVVLFMGSIGANEEVELLFPLPDGISVRETKRIDATLAWLSPVNWRHRQYRKAALSFVKPAGAIPRLGTPEGLASDLTVRGASTVQHQSWELDQAFASGQGSDMKVRVKCYGQAGGLLDARVDFAVALSLWVAPSINVDIYTQVKTQVEARVPIRPV